jgi:acid phosphatase type 7
MPIAPGDPSGATSAVLVGAGDIGMCGSPGPAGTGALLDLIPGTVFTTGDNAYPQGTAANFRECYDPAWGRHRARTRPVPGNHDYETPGASAYFEYFGPNAGPRGQGYYAYRAAAWLVLALNSELPATAGSEQLIWLRQTLATTATACTVAYWHRPVFSSGPNGDNAAMREAWRVLEEFSADLIIVGHEHMYERFAPQTSDGVANLRVGIRQIVVGTGGATLSIPRGVRRSTSEVVESAWGVLKLTLHPASYEFEFIAVPGSAFRDAGSEACH